MDDLTNEEIRKLRDLLSRATPGPWRSYIEGRDHQSGSSFIRTGGDDIELVGASEADQDFIALVRQQAPRLLDELERLRARLAARTAAE